MEEAHEDWTQRGARIDSGHSKRLNFMSVLIRIVASFIKQGVHEWVSKGTIFSSFSGYENKLMQLPFFFSFSFFLVTEKHAKEMRFIWMLGRYSIKTKNDSSCKDFIVD